MEPDVTLFEPMLTRNKNTATLICWVLNSLGAFFFFVIIQHQSFAQRQTRQILQNQQKRQNIISDAEDNEHSGPKGSLKKGQGQNLEEPEDPSAKELPLRQRARYGNEELEVDPD